MLKRPSHLQHPNQPWSFFLWFLAIAGYSVVSPDIYLSRQNTLQQDTGPPDVAAACTSKGGYLLLLLLCLDMPKSIFTVVESILHLIPQGR